MNAKDPQKQPSGDAMTAAKAREICKRWEKLTDPLSDEPQISEARGFLEAVAHAAPVLAELDKLQKILYRVYYLDNREDKANEMRSSSAQVLAKYRSECLGE